jgi:hypothetical protein
VLLELLFEAKSGVVAADRNGFGHVRFCAGDCALLEVDLG